METSKDVDVISYLEEKFPELDPDDGFKYPCRYLIDSSHLPVFADAIHTLLEFGMNILFFPDVEGITIKNCNIARTAAGEVSFNTEFFGAVRTYEWPERCPCASVLVRDVFMLLKKIGNHKNVEHLILDMEPLADGMIGRITYRTDAETTIIMKTCEIYANSLPKQEVPPEVTSLLNIAGREFRNVMVACGKGKEIGLYISQYGAVAHTICSRAMRAKASHSVIHIKDLVNAMVMKEETFVEVDVKDLLLLAQFAAANDEVMKIYFTDTEEPLFVVVDMSGLCSITFVLSTGAVDSVMVKNFVGQMIPSLYHDGYSSSIRLITQLPIADNNVDVVQIDTDGLNDDQIMDHRVLGVIPKPLPTQPQVNRAYEELTGLSLNAWNIHGEVTQPQLVIDENPKEVINIDVDKNIVSQVVEEIVIDEQEHHHVIEQNDVTQEIFYDNIDDGRRLVLELNETHHDVVQDEYYENQTTDVIKEVTTQSDVVHDGRTDKDVENHYTVLDNNSVEGEVNAHLDVVFGNGITDQPSNIVHENPISQKRTQSQFSIRRSLKLKSQRDCILDFLDRPVDQIDVRTEQVLRENTEVKVGGITAPAEIPGVSDDITMEHTSSNSNLNNSLYDSVHDVSGPTTSQEDAITSISHDTNSLRERQSVHEESKPYRHTLFEDIPVTDPSECTEEAFLLQKESEFVRPGHDRIPTRMEGGALVSGEEPEIVHFVNLRPRHFWEEAFAVRPVNTDDYDD
ncbi:unnamed protein product [Bursaphelenchus okinawaensis]|uniref:Uncharacterized protein n=1 Tax=Bursaphelenchus okinawaensis TaxID=465554 RepID=A0A811KHB0_9BILA|nr:unnamed protein product [Bursaphelenchus okinawaensis]CAG9104522.1 unnamed protein product [Bursaphelenchus okinawaensis]